MIGTAELLIIAFVTNLSGALPPPSLEVPYLSLEIPYLSFFVEVKEKDAFYPECNS
jgi:hypothetical protein